MLSRGTFTATNSPLVAGRVPVLPYDICERLLRVHNLGELRNEIERIRARNPEVEQALFLAAPQLEGVLHSQSYTADALEDPRVYLRVLAYLLRMSSRTTPFGLFAGIGLVSVGEHTTLRIDGDLAAWRTRARPDMKWLMSFARAVEKDPLIQDDLHLRLNAYSFERNGRLYLNAPDNHAYVEENDSYVLKYPPVSLKYTDLIRRLCERARGRITTFIELVNIAKEQGAHEQEARALIRRLSEVGLFTSDLRPTLLDDPLKQLSTRLT